MVEYTDESGLFIRRNINDSPRYVSNEDIPALWQAEFLIYLIIFKTLLTITFVLSEFSFHTFKFVIIVCLDLVGFVGISKFSLKMNKVYIFSIIVSLLLVLQEFLIEKMESLEHGSHNKMHIVFCVALFIFLIYQIYSHIRFSNFLNSVSQHRRLHLSALMKNNSISIFN